MPYTMCTGTGARHCRLHLRHVQPDRDPAGAEQRGRSRGTCGARTRSRCRPFLMFTRPCPPFLPIRAPFLGVRPCAIPPFRPSSASDTLPMLLDGQWFAWRALTRMLEVTGESSLASATCMNNLALVYMETQQILKARYVSTLPNPRDCGPDPRTHRVRAHALVGPCWRRRAMCGRRSWASTTPRSRS